jgi:SWI/SNF-related matrix-associated actin-dependent regulator of chromatin subfamily A-like protein 1
MTETVPRPYQEEGVRRIQKFGGRALLGDEMGLGKTPQALWWMERYLGPGPVLIICPATLTENWRREVAKHTGRGAAVLGGLTPPRRGLRAGPRDIFIINYDVLAPRRRRGGGAYEGWVFTLRDLRPRLLIVDEGQYIRGRHSARGRAVREIGAGVPHVLVLGGTACLEHRPFDVFPAAHLLWPERFPSAHLFGLKYCGAVKEYGAWDYRGASHTDVLYRVLRKAGLIRRRKRDVLRDLPPKTRQVVPLTLPDAARKVYDALADNARRRSRALEAELTKAKKARTRRKLRAERYGLVSSLRERTARLKLGLVTRWLEDFLESGEKLIAFGIHHSVLRPLLRHFGHRAALVDGSVTGRARQAALDRFNKDPSCRLLLGHVEAAGTGWSCTATSSVALLELPWGPATVLQCEGRVEGIGRGVAGRGAYSYMLVAEDTLEEWLCRALERKQKILEESLDGAAAGELNVYQEFLKELSKKKKG